MPVTVEMLLGATAILVTACLLVGHTLAGWLGQRRDPWLSAPLGLALLLVVSGIAAGFGATGGGLAIVIVAVIAVSVLITVVERRRRILVAERANDGGADESEAAGKGITSAMRGLAAGDMVVPTVAALIAALAAAIPFIANGQIGILGVGLVNDDMAAHLLLADWINERFLPEPVLVGQGYPMAPHALAAGLASMTEGNSVAAFAALTLAIPALLAGMVAAYLRDASVAARLVVATLVSLSYLGVAYLAQGAFKEPLLSLLLIAFVLRLGRPGRPLDPPGALALGLLVAAALYVYSFPALAWFAGAVVVWALFCLFSAYRDTGGKAVRNKVHGSVAAAVAAVGIALLLSFPELGRIFEFTDFKALDPSRANEGGLGNLSGGISPLEALGVWPSSEFRLPAGAGGVPTVAFYLGGLLGMAVLAAGMPRWWRRFGPALPAALAAAVAVYVGARLFGTVYTSAKALAILAPLVMLVGVGGLLAGVGRRERSSGGSDEVDPKPATSARIAPAPASSSSGVVPASTTSAQIAGPIRILLVAAFVVAALFSSFLVLRQAVVGPTAHPQELAEIRPFVQGERVLFLGRDNFVLWNLRGSEPYTHVRNYYDPYFVKPDPEVKRAGFKFDVDVLRPADLAEFNYVITTRAPHGSALPPEYRPLKVTDSYVLWTADGDAAGVVERERVEPDDEPGAMLSSEPCIDDRVGRPSELIPFRDRGVEPSAQDGATGATRPAEGSLTSAAPAGDSRRRTAGAGLAIPAGKPLRLSAEKWSTTALESGGTAVMRHGVAPGSWRISLRYDSTRPLTLTIGDRSIVVPANLDYRGVAPFWAVGGEEDFVVATTGDSQLEITATVEDPPALGRLLGTKSIAHLDEVVFTPGGQTYVGDILPPFPGDATALVAEDPGLPGCVYADWRD